MRAGKENSASYAGQSDRCSLLDYHCRINPSMFPPNTGCSMRNRQYKYERVLTDIRSGATLLQMIESGLTPQEVKAAVIELLEPYFEHREILEEFALKVLLPETVTVSRLLGDTWALDKLEQCLASHRSAKAANVQASLEACADWTRPTYAGLSVFWSQLHIERDKDTLDLEEFTHECLQNIGSLIEGPTKPYLKELLHQIRISRSEPVAFEQLEASTLGDTVDELIRKTTFGDLFAPPPWNIRLNQWRNIAQHLSTEINGNEIICRYGNPPKIREARISRNGLLHVARTLGQVFIVLKLSKTIYFLDNFSEIEALGLIPQNIPSRPEMLVMNFALAIASQGFELIDFQWNDNESLAVIRDVSEVHPNQRRLHASQFAFLLWQHTQSPRVTVEYHERDNTRNFRTSINEADCDRVIRGEIGWHQLANIVEMTDLKTGTVIPPLSNRNEKP